MALNQSPATTLPELRTPPRDTSESWWARWHLAALAIAAWVFTITGFVLDQFTDTSRPIIVGLFVLAYLAGGTLATHAAITDLLNRQVNIDLLMVLAAAGAAVLGQWLEGAILLSLFSTSNAMEHYSLARTQNAVRALMDLTPPTARVVRNGEFEIVDVEDLALKDVIVIQPGERIPADAIVLEGDSAVDQAAITGESVPVNKGVGDSLFAGTINGNGALRAEVEKLATDSTLSRIVRLVSDAQEDQSDLQEFAEGFEGKYAVFVILFSALVTVVPMFFGVDRSDAFYRGMTTLVVLSPCALVISTPAATLSALANAARKGVLVKGGRSMDTLGSVDVMAFDKTGTLTIGKPALTDVVTLNNTDAPQLLAVSAAAESLSEHPVAKAVVAAAAQDDLALPEASELQSLPGFGISAIVADTPILIGNERLMQREGVEISDAAREHLYRLGEEGKSTMFVAQGGHLLGLLAVADVLRPEVARIIQELKQAGVKQTVMLSGDNDRVARAIARQIGIDDVRADLLPEDKLDAINELKKQGKVAMLGDGVNDAPALATADVGIAMGAGGTDAALETADVVLMSDDLGKVSHVMGLSRKMRRIIKANLTFALTVIIVLASANLIVGIPLPLGVVGHEGSTVLVLLNGLRLLSYGGSWLDVVSRTEHAEVRQQLPEYRVTAA